MGGTKSVVQIPRELGRLSPQFCIACARLCPQEMLSRFGRGHLQCCGRWVIAQHVTGDRAARAS